MSPEDKRVDITIDRIVIREVEGRHWLILRDTEGRTYQKIDCLQVSRRGEMAEESEAILLMQSGDKVSLMYRTVKHAPWNSRLPTSSSSFDRPPPTLNRAPSPPQPDSLKSCSGFFTPGP